MSINIKAANLPTTGRGEKDRQVDSGLTSFPGAHEGLRMTEGWIREIHEDRAIVKVYADDGSVVADGQWIVLAHTSRSIAEEFGTVRKGMRVMVLFSGPDGARAKAFIIGEEGEKHINTPRSPNVVVKGFSFFPPGKGI